MFGKKFSSKILIIIGKGSACISICGIFASAFASETAPNQVERVISVDGLVYAYVKPPYTTTVCPKKSPPDDSEVRYYIPNDNSPSSNAMIALLLTAKAQKFNVILHGSGEVAHCKGGELLTFIQID